MDGKLYEMPVWPDVYEQCAHQLVENEVIALVVRIDDIQSERFSISGGMLMKGKQTQELKRHIDQLQEPKSRKKQMVTEQNEKIMIHLDCSYTTLATVLELRDIFQDNPGTAQVAICFEDNGQKKQLEVSSFRVNPIPVLLDRIANIGAVKTVDHI